MSQRQSSWKLWVGIIVVLIVTGLVAVLWPAIAGAFQFSPSAPSISAPSASASTIAITVPTPPLPFLPTFGLEPGQVVEVNGLLIMAALAGVVAALVIGAGVVLGLINLILSRLATNVETSDSYQEHVKVLEQKQNEKLKAIRSDRPADPVPDGNYVRWAAWATGLVILMFVYFLTLLTVRTLAPQAQNTTLIVGIVALVTILILALRLRPARLQAIDSTDNEGIPWDTIMVIITGLLVVGVGIGLMVYFNIPA